MKKIAPEDVAQPTNRNVLQYVLLLTALALSHLFSGEDRDYVAATIGIFIGSVVMLIGLSIMIPAYAFKGATPKRKDIVQLAYALFFVTSVGYFLAYFIAQFYFATAKAIVFPFSSITIVTCIAFASILAVGSAFFYFRLKSRFTYGLVEAIAGACIGSQKIYSEGALDLSQVASQPVAVVVLTGGIYLVVRGLDNMHNGLNSDFLGRLVSKWVDSVKQSNSNADKKE